MEFIRNCLLNAQNMYQLAVEMDIDNFLCHASIEVVFHKGEIAHHRLLRLIPYSRIEFAWSSLKDVVKVSLTTARTYYWR